MSDLTNKQCEPCEGDIDPMSTSEAKNQLEKINEWDLMDVPKINKSYSFSDFVTAIDFVDEIAEISETEGHHPNITINYDTVDVTIWTHAIDGLSDNDFILAAKFDEAAENFD